MLNFNILSLYLYFYLDLFDILGEMIWKLVICSTADHFGAQSCI